MRLCEGAQLASVISNPVALITILDKWKPLAVMNCRKLSSV